MRKNDRHSAQCAWLFSHAHLIGESGIPFKDRTQVHLRRSLAPVLDFVRAALRAAPFLTALGFFFVIFVEFTLLIFFAEALCFAEAFRKSFSRSARRSSSWCGLSTSMQGSAKGHMIARPLMPMRSETIDTNSSREILRVNTLKKVPNPMMLACFKGLLRLPINCSHISRCSVAMRTWETWISEPHTSIFLRRV